MKYLFILGRNIELSIAEVNSFLKRIGNKVIGYKQKENAILVEIEKPIEDKIIDNLGGVIALGSIIPDMDKEELYFGTSNKMNYVIWDFSDKTDKVREYLKRRFKHEKLKATEKRLGRMMELQNGKTASTLSTRNLDEQFFTFDDYFGRIIQVCDYEKIEKRDMEKPVRRSALSISPRLAKIMINLSEIRKGKLVDGFCGIGAILSEADFGELLKKIPTKEKARETAENFENLMVSVINNLKKKISGRFVFSVPYIRTINQRVSCNIEKISRK